MAPGDEVLSFIKCIHMGVYLLGERGICEAQQVEGVSQLS